MLRKLRESWHERRFLDAGKHRWFDAGRRTCKSVSKTLLRVTIAERRARALLRHGAGHYVRRRWVPLPRTAKWCAIPQHGNRHHIPLPIGVSPDRMAGVLFPYPLTGHRPVELSFCLTAG